MFDAETLNSFAIRQGFDWPELADLFDRSVGATGATIWDYPRQAYRAVTGYSSEEAEWLVLAYYCATLSIRLVDDILDEDPEGQQHRLGTGRTSNLALAIQALGSLLLEECGLPESIGKRVRSIFQSSLVFTALGQDRDAVGAQDERDYWRIVDAKTPPLIASAFEAGAVLAGADEKLAERFAAFGRSFALLVQISDDLTDALAVPASPDWKRPMNNLALHYASTVAHDDQQRFLDLLCAYADPDGLKQAQDVLWTSGAVSFCTWHLLERFHELSTIFATMDLEDPGPLRELLHQAAIGPQLMLEAGGATPQEARDMLLPAVASPI